MLKALWQPAGTDPGDLDFSDAGTYPNLFDACPPFQIDGNFGATAAIMEFFVQSQGKGDTIRLLPALPSAAIFQNGAVRGLRARNGFAVDMTWKDRKINRLIIHSYHGKTCRIALPDKRILSFPTIAGRNYSII
jgi:alpha-L-fucosidase 2